MTDPTPGGAPLTVPDAGRMVRVTWFVTPRTARYVTEQAEEHGMRIGEYLDRAFAKRGNW